MISSLDNFGHGIHIVEIINPGSSNYEGFVKEEGGVDAFSVCWIRANFMLLDCSAYKRSIKVALLIC